MKTDHEVVDWERRMNKGQLIEVVAAELATSKAQASRAVDAVVNGITTGIKHDKSVTIVGFGCFAKKKRGAAHHPESINGAPMDIDATTTVGFKPAQALKDEMVPI